MNNTSFENKIVLVISGASAMSKCIVNTFLKQNAIVIVPVKSLGEMNAIKAFKDNADFENLTTHITDLSDYDKAFEFTEIIQEKYGKIDITIEVFDHLMCSNQLTNVCMDDWLKLTDDNLTSFFVTARVVLTVMKKQKEGFFVSVSANPMAEKSHSSPLSKIAAYTRTEMSKILAEEAGQENVRYYHLCMSNAAKEAALRNIPETVFVEPIGNHIMNLYHKEYHFPDDLFQQVEGNEIHAISL